MVKKQALACFKNKSSIFVGKFKLPSIYVCFYRGCQETAFSKAHS
jgi:hypothetical protein